MTIIAVDPRPDKLALLTGCIAANHPDAEIKTFCDPLLAFQFGFNNAVDSVYTVIDMNRLTGLELAMMLRKLYPKLRVSFISDKDCYRREAQRLAAYTYIMEPVTELKLRQSEADAQALGEEYELA